MVDGTPWEEHFSLDPDRVWINASHQGPLPDVAAEAATDAIRWKQRPNHLITPELFTSVPERVRAGFASVIGARPDQIALANSASYGLHVVANGLGLGADDEVVVAANDFPSDILPWMNLAPDGVEVRAIEPAGSVVTPDEVAAAITPRTRVLCLTWVHSLSGQIIDLDAIGSLCRANGVVFVVNGSQGVGGIPIRVADHPFDALVSVGFKYLCGPYGTGFLWLHDDLVDRLRPAKLYWLSAFTADDLAQPRLDLDSLDLPAGAARHDVFGTANFFNYAALGASVDLISGIGVDRIYPHNLATADDLIARLDPTRYEVQDRGPEHRRLAIVFVRPLAEDLASFGRRLDGAGIDVAKRVGMARFSPHLYNTDADIDRIDDALR